MATRPVGSPYNEAEHMKVIGRVKKFPNLKMRRIVDEDFMKFTKGRALDLPFRNAKPTSKAIKVGVMKYNKPEPPKPKELIQAEAWLARMYGPFMKGEVISFDDAVEGMEKTPSPGYPWNIHYREKQEVLDSHDAWLREYIENFETMPAPRAIWQSSLKEEIRHVDKLKKHKIRQFSGAPIELVIMGRMLFLEQNEGFYDSHCQTFSAVGLTMTSGGWSRIYKQLSRFSHGFALDESEWDSSMARWLMEAIRNFRIRLLKRSNATERDVAKAMAFYQEVIDSVYCLPEGELIQKQIGNPSGSPNTVVDNTLALSLLFFVTWIRRCGGNYTQMRDNLSALLYGDDNTFTVSPEFIERFNGEALRDEFKTMGVTIKNSEEELKPRPLEQLDFLSFGFHRVGPGLALPLHKDPQKLLASIAYRDSREHTIALKLQRVLAVREMLLGNEAAFEVIDRYATSLWQEYAPLQDQELVKVWNQRKTKEEIALVYLGIEGGRPFKFQDGEENYQGGNEAKIGAIQARPDDNSGKTIKEILACISNSSA